jgi:thiamine-phosphate pyrophosphorylase
MREVYRILDANANRAREALRGIEDFARFALDDAALSAAAKQMRSRLQETLARLPAEALLASRDTPGDVGTQITTPTEGRRADAATVAAAACKRLTEALRTLEEYAKTVSAAAAEDFQKLRYEAYTLEQRLARRHSVAERFRKVRLYVLLTAGLCRGDPLAVARAVIEGGADCIQLREKDMPDAKRLDLAAELRQLTLGAGVLLIINDRPDIAAAVGADGVHLGQQDLPVHAARRVLPGWSIVGKSTHNLSQLRAAADEGPDYIAVGPMFPTATKDAGPVASPPYLRQALTETTVPLVAIGGITPANVAALIEAGAERVAVCSAIISAEDPAAAARQIKKQLTAESD